MRRSHPFAAQVEANLVAAVDRLGPDFDYTGIVKHIEATNGVDLRPNGAVPDVADFNGAAFIEAETYGGHRPGYMLSLIHI